MPRLGRSVCPAMQADILLSQNNPVSTTLYPVLATTRNVRIITIMAQITWAVTQPTPLEVVVTVDGRTIIYQVANPVSTTFYGARVAEIEGETTQALGSIDGYGPFRAFLLEGRSVKVDARITWAVTQPSPLACRLKYAKW